MDKTIAARQAIHYAGDLFIDDSIGDHRSDYRPLASDGPMTSPNGELNPEGFVDTFYRGSLIS